MASERSVEVDDLHVGVVSDVHLKRSKWSTTLSGQTVSVLLGIVDLLTHGVEHLVLVGSLKPSHRLQDLNLLLDQELVDAGEVVKARRTARWKVRTTRSTHAIVRLLHDGRGRILILHHQFV